ncbi:hypothetical protein P4J23_10945 [Bacillus cereus]|nr:hypothetical protein [Bacillus cereus]
MQTTNIDHWTNLLTQIDKGCKTTMKGNLLLVDEAIKEVKTVESDSILLLRQSSNLRAMIKKYLNELDQYKKIKLQNEQEKKQ